MRNLGTDIAEKQKNLIQHALDAKQSGSYLFAGQLNDDAITMGEQGYLANAYYNKGVLAMEQKQYGQALTCFQEAVSLYPEYENAWVNLGAALLAFNRNAEALYAFEKASALSPDRVYSLFNRAYALNRLRRYHEAYLILKNLIEMEERTKVVSETLADSTYKLYGETGLCCLQLNDHQRALHFFQKAFNLNTSDYQTCYNLAFIYDLLKDFGQAILFYDLSIALDPNEFKGYQGKACTLIHMKCYDEALELITQAINLSPDNFEAYYNLACIYAGQKQKENMVNAILKTIQLTPSNVDIKKHFRTDNDFAAFANDPAFVKATS